MKLKRQQTVTENMLHSIKKWMLSTVAFGLLHPQIKNFVICLTCVFLLLCCMSCAPTVINTKQRVAQHLLQPQGIESKSPENVTLGDLLIDMAILEKKVLRGDANLEAIGKAINTEETQK